MGWDALQRAINASATASRDGNANHLSHATVQCPELHSHSKGVLVCVPQGDSMTGRKWILLKILVRFTTVGEAIGWGLSCGGSWVRWSMMADASKWMQNPNLAQLA